MYFEKVSCYKNPKTVPFYQNLTITCMKGHVSMLMVDYVLRRAAKASNFLTLFQIIKLVFISYRMYLAVTGNPLICNSDCMSVQRAYNLSVSAL